MRSLDCVAPLLAAMQSPPSTCTLLLPSLFAGRPATVFFEYAVFAQRTREAGRARLGGDGGARGVADGERGEAQAEALLGQLARADDCVDQRRAHAADAA